MMRLPGARLSTSSWRAAHTATRPKGRLTRKAQRQPPSCTRAPPIGGPTPAATAADAPHTPMAWARRSAGKAAMTSASEAGTSIAAPKAWNTRARMRNSTDGARPHAADAMVNTATPATNDRRRPTRSVSRPHRMSEAAKTML